MSKRGMENSILFLGTLVISIVITASLLAAISSLNKGGWFEKRFLSKDLGLVVDAAQCGVGSWNYIYPNNLSGLGLMVKLFNGTVYVRKSPSDIPFKSWYTNNTNINWTYKVSNDKFIVLRNASFSTDFNFQGSWTFGGVVGKFNFILPVKNPIVTSPYGYRVNPKNKNEREFHSGIDLVPKVNSPDTPIYAVANGTVIKVRNFCHGQCNTYALGYGNFVYIDHGVIDGHDVRTFYAHLRNAIVSKGEYVHKGEIIGYMDSTGFSTGKHLHFEVLIDGKNVDPALYLPKIN